MSQEFHTRHRPDKRMSMKITVLGHAKFKALMGEPVPMVLDMENGCLRDALETLAALFGEKFENLLFDRLTKKEKRSNLILLNGQSHLNLKERSRVKLKDGDQITLLPAVIGG